MAKKKVEKVREVREYKLELKFTCPNTRALVSYFVKNHEFHASDYPCDMCGSHGEIELQFECESCGVYHEIEVRSW